MRRSSRAIRIAVLVGLVVVVSCPAAAQDPEPISFTVRFPRPATQYAEVEARVPTDGRASIDLMMPIWSPGFYRVEDYAGQVEELTARTPDGTRLEPRKTRRNRWSIPTNGAPLLVVSYRLLCSQRSVTTNWVGAEFGVLNGAATFVTLADSVPRAHEVRLELPPVWPTAMTALEPAPDSQPNHYRAPDFDTLVDSPILAGKLEAHDFEVAGTRHFLVAAGDRGQWDGRRAAGDLERLVQETRRLWGQLPFRRYLFLIVFRQGGGGLEHKGSSLVTANPVRAGTPSGYRAWLGLVAHEYMHAFNGKRLRPIELGPFDYEREPRTTSLWIAEGLTTYFSDLALRRAGLITAADFLGALSGRIQQLQGSPGRLVQTLEQSSLDVWTNSLSGVNPDAGTVSYYVKGQVIGFLLDAKIRRATGGAKSLEDVMRLAYERYAGERGYTPEQFRQTAEELAGVDLAGWFTRATASTDELDYDEALDWFGLRFATRAKSRETTWSLEVRTDANETERRRLRAWLDGRAP